MSAAPLRLAVLASGSGSNLQALLDAQAAGATAYEIVAVLSDRADAGAIQRALKARIPALYVPLRKGVDRAVWAEQLAAVLRPFQPELVLLAGWMRLLPTIFLEHMRGQVINQHPALLPNDESPTYTTSAGLTIPAVRGAHAVRDALAQGLPVTGCTVHWVTPAMDVGPVLARAEVPVLASDDEATLHERIKEQERRLIVAVIAALSGQRQRWLEGGARPEQIV